MVWPCNRPTPAGHPACSCTPMALPTPRKGAAVNRLASSITQLTLCQVTTSEIDAARQGMPEAPRYSIRPITEGH